MTTNCTEHIQNSARGTKVPKSHSKHIQNGAESTNVTTNLKNIAKTVHKELAYQTLNLDT